MTRSHLSGAFTAEELAEIAGRGITFGVELDGPHAGSYWARGPKGMTGRGRSPRQAVEDLFGAKDATRVSRCSTCQDSYAAGVATCPMCAGPMVDYDVPTVGDDGLAAA